MTDTLWHGGATATAQVDDVTPDTVTTGNTFTVTLTSEPGSDGTTTDQSETYTAAADTVADVVAGLVEAINTSTKTLFQRVTATDDGTTRVLVTADEAGRPFYLSASSADGTGSAGHGNTRAAVTASSGPNDWNVAGNWSNGIPTTGEDVAIVADDDGVSWSILYGLDQSAIDLESLKESESWTGSLGDYSDGRYLTIDVSNSADAVYVRRSDGDYSMIFGEIDNVVVTRTNMHAASLIIGGTIGTMVVSGPHARGLIRVRDSADLTSLQVINAHNAIVEVGESVTTFSTFGQNSGTTRIRSTPASGSICEGVCEHYADGGAAMTIDGGTLHMIGGGTPGTWVLNRGTVDFSRNRSASITFTSVIVRGGMWLEVGSASPVTYTAFSDHSGGNATIKSESSPTVVALA